MAAQEMFLAIGASRGQLATTEQAVLDAQGAGAISEQQAGQLVGELTRIASDIAVVEAETAAATTSAESAALMGRLNALDQQIQRVGTVVQSTSRASTALKYGLWTLGGLAVAGAVGYWILRPARRAGRRRRRRGARRG